MRFSLFFLLACLLSPSLLAQIPELRIALWLSDARTTRVVTQNVGLSAFNEALAREICRRIQARCTMENVLFGEIIPGIAAGQYDMGFGNFLRTPERERHVAFSDPIWSSSSRLLGRSDSNRRLQSRFGDEIRLDKLHDVRIAAVLGSQQYRHLESIAGERRLTLTGVKTLGETFALLRDGHVDFCLLPMLPAYDRLRTEKPGHFEFVGPPMVDNGLGGTVHIALTRERDTLRQEVNTAIAGLRADGTYPRLLRQYFPFSLE